MVLPRLEAVHRLPGRRVRRLLGGSAEGSIAEGSRGLLSTASAFDPSRYDELPFIDVAVLRSNHTEAHIDVGPGEGDNMLLVNVSGQLALAPLAFAPPNLTSVEPPSVPTAGGAIVTVRGLNFGVGQSFALRLRGPGDDAQAEACHFEWTEADLAPSAGGGNLEGAVLEFAQGSLKFVAPAGQCDVAMNLTLTVAGQESLQSLPFSFDPPEITMLSKDGSAPLGSDCDRRSESGCGLLTDGGYDITITGVNFGVRDRQVQGGGERRARGARTCDQRNPFQSTFLSPWASFS